jgi:hypothetical protein
MRKIRHTLETFARIRAKASRHATNNPLALFRREVSVDDVLCIADVDAGRDDPVDGVPADLRRRGGRFSSPASLRAAASSDATVSIAGQAMTTDHRGHLRCRRT